MGASWRRRCTARVAEGKTPTRGHGACMAGAGRSQRQNARRNTISTVVLALIRPPALVVAGGLEFRSVFRRAGLAGIARATTGFGPESARYAAGGIDLPACSSGGGGLNCQPNQPLTA